jgi:hypothetical protein
MSSKVINVDRFYSPSRVAIKMADFGRSRRPRSRYWTLIGIQIILVSLICSTVLYAYVFRSLQEAGILVVPETQLSKAFMVDIVTAQQEQNRLEVTYS